jgi:hypothetical protein
MYIVAPDITAVPKSIINTIENTNKFLIIYPPTIIKNGNSQVAYFAISIPFYAHLASL